MNPRAVKPVAAEAADAPAELPDFPITTLEQQRSIETGTLDLYFQRENAVCRHLLLRGTNPDDLEAVRRLR